NGGKSAAMNFGPISSNPSRHPSSCLTLRGTDIPWVAEHKYVGVWFSSVQRDILHTHYELERKRDTASYVFWRSVLGCNLHVGCGRLPPIVGLGLRLYYALINPHLMHRSDIIIDVDHAFYLLLENLNTMILPGSYVEFGALAHAWTDTPQLYSELGVLIPLAHRHTTHIRRMELALRYLR
ncbi:hypothetical protein GGX14DRAFT_356740, partial [Mycena pura]